MDIEKQTGVAPMKTLDEIQWQKAVRTWSILVKLFGLNISVNKAKIFNLLLDGSANRGIIDEIAESKSVFEVSDVFLASLAADRMKFCEFCQNVRQYIENDNPTSRMTDEFISGCALGIFQAACAMDSDPDCMPYVQYEGSVTDLSLTLMRKSSRSGNGPFGVDRQDKIYHDRLSKAIKEYFRADCFAAKSVQAKRLKRRIQAAMIFDDFNKWQDISGNNYISELGEYIMQQIIYAVLSPMSVEEQVRLMMAQIPE